MQEFTVRYEHKNNNNNSYMETTSPKELQWDKSRVWYNIVQPVEQYNKALLYPMAFVHTNTKLIAQLKYLINRCSSAVQWIVKRMDEK